MIRAITGVSLGVFGVLMALAAPGVTWFDGGELAAAGATLGIAHPTGFPAWAVLAHAAALLPFGEIAFRVTLLSAALAAATGGVTAWAAWRLTGRVEALTAAALVPFSPLIFPHAVAIEVYALHALTTAGLLAMTAWLATDGDRRRILVAALVVGLMLGGHGETRLLVLPALAAVVWMRRADITPAVLAGAGAVCALGLAVHLMLPVRSAAGVVRDWARPDQLSAFIDHVAATRIRLAFADRMFQPTATDWARFAEQAAPAVGGMLALSIAGLARHRIARTPAPIARVPALVAVALLVVDVLYSVGVNPMGLVDLQNGTVTFVAAGLLAAALIPRIVTPLVLLFPVLAISTAGAGVSDSEPRRYGTDALAQVGPHGLLLTTSDHLSSLTLWLRDIEGARPDAYHLIRQHAWVPVHAQGLAAIVRKGDTPASLARRESGRRSVRWEHGGGREEEELLDVLDAGVPTFAVGAPGGDLPDPTRYGVRVAADQLNRLGLDAVRRGAPQRGRQLFEAASRLDDGSAAAHQNLGAVASMMGRPDDAVRHTERALEIAADSVTAWVNLGRYELIRRHNDAAGVAFQRALDLDSTLAVAWSGMGAVEANRGRRRLAADHLLHALALDPTLEEARINLAKLTAPHPGGSRAAAARRAASPSPRIPPNRPKPPSPSNPDRSPAEGRGAGP